MMIGVSVGEPLDWRTAACLFVHVRFGFCRHLSPIKSEMTCFANPHFFSFALACIKLGGYIKSNTPDSFLC